MNQTSLLKFLFVKTAEVKLIHGARSSTGNHFFVALLRLLNDRDNGELPEELTSEECKAELASAEKLLLPYGINDRTKLAETILAETAAEAYSSKLDDFMFSKIGFTLQAKSNSNGNAPVTICDYLEEVLKDPPKILEKYISGKTEKTEKKPERKTEIKTEAAPAPEAEKPKSKTRKIAEKTAEKTYEPNESELSKIVRNTKRIQSELLEHIYGQDHAIDAFTAGYFQAQLSALGDKKRSKPQALFLFAGPPGVGKTFLSETAAEALGLPFKRFDMSEYVDKEANFEFCGSDKVYKNGKAGNVTSFVEENPQCVLLFDEIEKAHLNIIHLFLQMLDAGRLRDNYTDTEVSFTDAIIIFTTNAGKNLYEDPKEINLSTIPKKKILKALSTDLKPESNTPLFPAAICSRFASGNIVMFNRLAANDLLTISKRELLSQAKSFEKTTGIKIEIDPEIPAALLFADGGRADARTVKGRASAFFHDELYEFFRLLSDSRDAVDKIKTIKLGISGDDGDREIVKLFKNFNTPEILVFASEEKAKLAESLLPGIKCYSADNIPDAKEILFNHDVSIILTDIFTGVKEGGSYLNVEDIDSVGRDFLSYAISRYTTPIYVLEDKEGDISREEFLSLTKLGCRDLITMSKRVAKSFRESIEEKCTTAYQQDNMLKLERESKVLTFRTLQRITDGGTAAEIRLFNFRLTLATDIGDSKNMLDAVSKPTTRFEDVIGAEDAKGELGYFVDYLQNPVKYLRRGVKAPKGILLYGPPGTGKTMLARAMAGESDVTFLTAEGNQFIKSLVGQGAQEIHAIFTTARKYAPSIIFIDEIDAIAKNRGSSSSAENASDALTAFLTEMDGFKTDTSKPVFVLAATNYDIEQGTTRSLDPAVLRRFDRRIYIDLPTKDERKKFLKLKLAKNAIMSLSEEHIENIAVRSTGMSLADLDSVCEMALRNAIRTNDGSIGDTEFDEAFETFTGGEVRKWSDESLERTARHEAGHALLSWLAGDKPSYLTIVARGNHGGYMQHSDNEGKGTYTRAELLAKIRTSLGGRAAELVYYGGEEGLTTGIYSDLRRATELARDIICSYGMDAAFGFINLEGDNRSTAVNDRIKEILSKELERAMKLILENRECMDKMVMALLERNHLKENEIDELFSKYATSKI